MEKAVLTEERLAMMEKWNASFLHEYLYNKMCSVIVHLHLNRYPRSLGLPHPK